MEAREFQSTPSPRRATTEGWFFLKRDSEFQSTPSPRRATGGGGIDSPPLGNFNPRPPRGGRQFDATCGDIKGKISIHALPAEGDEDSLAAPGGHGISIHALPAEGDLPP